MSRSRDSRRALTSGRTRAVAAGAALLMGVGAVAACSSDSPPPAAPAGTSPGTTAAVSIAEMTAEQRVAEAKTQAVGYFEALATLDYAKAKERSSGSAADTVTWTESVNGIAAVKGTPYETAVAPAPNVRVQFAELTTVGGGKWTASGFVELGYRPGPVQSAPTSTVPPTTNTSGSTVVNTNTFVTDLVFTESGSHLAVEDFRLDDTPYPVSQLFVAASGDSGRATVDQAEATLTFAHRDFDGSVQYLVDVRNGGAVPLRPSGVRFEPKDAADRSSTASLFSDEMAAGATGRTLVVIPGAFPGVNGTVILELPGDAGPAGSTTSSTVPAPRLLRMAAPDWPTLTPRPVNAVRNGQAGPSTTTTSTSTTSTTAAGATPTVTVTVPGSTTTSTASTTTSTRPTTTST